MLKNIYFIIICVFFSCNGYTNKSLIHEEKKWVWNDSISMEQNVAYHAIPLRTDKDFTFLDELLIDKSVILLGERTHYELYSTGVRLNMIDYLKEKGFSIIGMEAVPFLSSYVFSNPDYQELTKDWNINEFIKLTLAESTSINFFSNLLRNDGIRIWGIDVYMGIYDIQSVQAILNKYKNDEQLLIDWTKLQILFERKFIYFNNSDFDSLTISEQYDMMRMIDSISNYVHYLMSLYGKTDDLKVLVQWIRNVHTAFSYVDYFEEKIPAKSALAFRNRDLQMAENIIWMTENFPEERFIVWAANFHGTKSISQTTYPTDSLLYFTFQSMGEHLFNKLDDKFYSIAFTTLDKEEEKVGLLEREISYVTNNAPYAFIDFKSLRYLPGYRDKAFDCAAIMKKEGKWLYIFDGMYYINKEKLFFNEYMESSR